MSITLNGDSGITAPTYAGNVTAEYSVPVTAFKNRIINGAMVIDQRNAGASVTATTSNPYTLDRWVSYGSQNSKYTTQQNAGSVTPPAGFTYYMGITSSSAYTVGASEVFVNAQYIEGYNIADLSWGTANAKTVTLSFWVRSSLTGTFGGSILNNLRNRCYIFSYTISSANTWTQISITIPGDTTGTWESTTNRGMGIYFSVGTGSTLSGTAGSWGSSELYAPTGSVSVVGTNGATFYITGVQLEKGSTATSFDYRPYGTELQLCQRYYWIKRGNDGGGQYQAIASGTCVNTTTPRVFLPYPVSMRAAPTISYAGSILVQTNSSAINVTAIPNTYNGVLSSMIEFSLTAGVTAGNGAVAYLGNLSGDYIQATAEL